MSHWRQLAASLRVLSDWLECKAIALRVRAAGGNQFQINEVGMSELDQDQSRRCVGLLDDNKPRCELPGCNCKAWMESGGCAWVHQPGGSGAAIPAPAEVALTNEQIAEHLPAPAYHDGFGRSPDLWTLAQIGEGVRAALAAYKAQPKGTVADIPEGIRKVIENLHTQDNRITANPLFAVQQKRVIGGLEDGYEDGWTWVSEDSEEIHDADRIGELNARFKDGEDKPDGCRRVGYIEKWEFVTGCLTEEGCKQYLRLDGHNLREPRIYAYGGYRNVELEGLRNWLMSLRGAASVAAQAPAPAHPQLWRDGGPKALDPTKIQLCRVGVHSADAQAMGQNCDCQPGTCRMWNGGLKPAVEAPAVEDDREALFQALRETQEACDVSQCPWCGHWGQGYAENEKPADYCHHDQRLKTWRMFAKP